MTGPRPGTLVLQVSELLRRHMLRWLATWLACPKGAGLSSYCLCARFQGGQEGWETKHSVGRLSEGGLGQQAGHAVRPGV
jgi:hypothetical protein